MTHDDLGSLQAEAIGIKNNGYIHKFGMPIFGDILFYVSEPINNDTQIFCYTNIYSYIQHMKVFFLHQM